MLMNLRNALMAGKRTPTAKDYVQSGLVAMWDGIENAGWGVHDPNATTWKDLIGNRDWTLGPSTSYEWTDNSFDAKDKNAATQDFIDGSLVSMVEFCAKIRRQESAINGNYAFVILGRFQYGITRPYYGLLFRNANGTDLALMAGLSYFNRTYPEFSETPASFSFPDYATSSKRAYFDGVSRAPNANNTLDYNASQRGTVARIGGLPVKDMPIEIYNMRLYSRALTADEIARNYNIDKLRFNLP